MTAGESATPADGTVLLLQRMRALLLECRSVAEQLQAVPAQDSPAAAADRIAYGVLVAALEDGLVTALQHAVDVLGRFTSPAGVLGEQWLSEQERKLGTGSSASS